MTANGLCRRQRQTAVERSTTAILEGWRRVAAPTEPLGALCSWLRALATAPALLAGARP